MPDRKGEHLVGWVEEMGDVKGETGPSKTGDEFNDQQMGKMNVKSREEQ